MYEDTDYYAWQYVKKISKRDPCRLCERQDYTDCQECQIKGKTK